MSTIFFSSVIGIGVVMKKKWQNIYIKIATHGMRAEKLKGETNACSRSATGLYLHASGHSQCRLYFKVKDN